jgi:hypothetical protein
MRRWCSPSWLSSSATPDSNTSVRRSFTGATRLTISKCEIAGVAIATASRAGFVTGHPHA